MHRPSVGAACDVFGIRSKILELRSRFWRRNDQTQRHAQTPDIFSTQKGIACGKLREQNKIANSLFDAKYLLL